MDLLHAVPRVYRNVELSVHALSPAFPWLKSVVVGGVKVSPQMTFEGLWVQLYHHDELMLPVSLQRCVVTAEHCCMQRRGQGMGDFVARSVEGIQITFMTTNA